MLLQLLLSSWMTVSVLGAPYLQNHGHPTALPMPVVFFWTKIVRPTMYYWPPGRSVHRMDRISLSPNQQTSATLGMRFLGYISHIEITRAELSYSPSYLSFPSKSENIRQAQYLRRVMLFQQTFHLQISKFMLARIMGMSFVK